MHCVVTAGPTFEPLDEARRLTNFSTGRLGSELADYLAAQGHTTTLLVGQQAAHRGTRTATRVDAFTTTASLAQLLQGLAGQPVDAVFHAAAVSDFAFGKVWTRSPTGQLVEVKSGKFSTRHGTLLAELVPTPKIIASLREWFPRAVLVGWKYEIEGNRAAVIELAQQQVAQCRTNACVANGPAYGPGFGLVRAGKVTHLSDPKALFEALNQLLQA